MTNAKYFIDNGGLFSKLSAKYAGEFTYNIFYKDEMIGHAHAASPSTAIAFWLDSKRGEEPKAVERLKLDHVPSDWEDIECRKMWDKINELVDVINERMAQK